MESDGVNVKPLYFGDTAKFDGKVDQDTGGCCEANSCVGAYFQTDFFEKGLKTQGCVCVLVQGKE